MASLKTNLKNIRAKINSGEHEAALELINDLLSSGVEDYTLLLFAGYINKLFGNLSDALKHYRRAIDINPDQNQAWKEAFKIVSSAACVDSLDDFALTIVDHLIQETDKMSNLDNFLLYKSVRIEFLIRLKKVDFLLKENHTEFNKLNDEIMFLLLKLLDVNKSDHLALIKSLLNKISISSCVNEETHYLVCTYLQVVKPGQEFTKWIIDHLSRFHDCKHTFIVLHAFSILTQHLFLLSLTDVQELIEIVAVISPSETIPDMEFCQQLLKSLSDQNLNDVYDLVITVDAERLSKNLLTLSIVLYVYQQLGQFYRISALLTSDFLSSLCFSNEDKAKLLELKVVVNFILCETLDEFELVRKELINNFKLDSSTDASIFFKMSNSLKCIFVQCEIKTQRVLTQEEFDSLLKKYFNADQSDEKELTAFFTYFLTAHFLFNIKDLETARDELREAMQITNIPTIISQICNCTVLNAEILIARNQRQLAISQLVNAAQQNPYCSEIFCLLAENLFITGNFSKARLCAERSKLLNPTSERIAVLLYAIYGKSDSDEALQIEVVRSLLTKKTNSKWALRLSTIFDINEGNLESAIEKVQRLLRIKILTNQVDNVNSQREMSALWIFLSEAYKQQGNLQSATRTCKAVLEVFPDNISALLQLIQLYQGMGQYESALEISDKLLALSNWDSNNICSFAKMLQALSIVFYITDDSRLVFEQRSKLLQLFKLLKDLLEDSALNTSILLQIIVARSLDVLLKFNDKYFSVCIAELKLSDLFWNIVSRQDAIQSKIQCLGRVLQQKPTSASTWNELALAFLVLYDLNNDETILNSAIKSTKSKIKISQFYCTLAKVYVYKKNSKRTQHCLIRAIQLNRHSADAWCLLALLYLKLNLFNEALFSMNEAQKINPQLMEAWLAHALHAEATNDRDVMDLYRHTLVLKPTELSAKKYCYFLLKCKQRKVFIDDGTMINFETLKDLKYKSFLDETFFCALALLAENFGCYADAKDFLSCINNLTLHRFNVNRDRILIKSNCGLQGDFDNALLPLNNLYHLPKLALFELIQRQSNMSKLFGAIRNDNVSAFSEVYKASYFPLIVCASILFNLEITQKLFDVIENVRPLHKLVELYPYTDVCRSDLFQQQDKEEIILQRHDYLSKKLQVILSKMSEVNN